jgi:hypothetical protein
MTNVVVVLRSYQFILIPVALGLLLPTLLMPWVVINLLGINGLTPVDLVRGSYELSNASESNPDASETAREQPELVFLDLVSSYNVTGLYLLWISAYLGSIVTMILAAILKKWRARITVVAGALAIAAGLAWFVSIEVLKMNFVEQASLTGGLIGEEFRGNERALIDSIVMIGLGPFLAATAGAIGVLSYLANRYLKKRNDSDFRHQQSQPP